MVWGGRRRDDEAPSDALRGEAGELVRSLTAQGVPPETDERHRLVRLRLPELRDLGQGTDELFWPVSDDGRVTLHPDLRELNDQWLARALRLRSLRAQDPDPEPAAGLVEQVLGEVPAPPGDLPQTPPRAGRGHGADLVRRPAPLTTRTRATRRGRGVLGLVLVLAAFVLFLVVLAQVLQEVRDVRARGLVEKSAAAYAAGIAEAGPGVQARLGEVFAEAVPAPAVRERYYKGDVVPAWTVLAETAAGREFVVCVEMRSVSGDEAYAAAWATSDAADAGSVTRTVKGEGCGPEPGSHADAAAAADAG